MTPTLEPPAPTTTEVPPPPASHTGARRPSSNTRPLEPLAPGRYRVQLTAGAELKNKLEFARDLMRHSLPSGDLSAIVAHALDLLIEQIMKRRFGAGKQRPRRSLAPAPARSNPPKSSPASSVSRSTRREVLERDGLRCSFCSEDGVRCGARGWLEDDHAQPRARGGSSETKNIRFLCRAHKQWAAERAYGRALTQEIRAGFKTLRA